MESLFQDWVQDGMLIRLDIRHWLHRWDAVVIKQTHSKYGAFMSAMAGVILAYSDGDMAKLISAIRKGNEALKSGYSDQQMIQFVTPHQLRSYVRRVTRGVEVRYVILFVINIQIKHELINSKEKKIQYYQPSN